MSYKCDNCKEIRYGTELKHVAEIRNVVYTRVFERFDRRQNKVVSNYDASFNGTEIVKEKRLCEKCHKEIENTTPINKTTKDVTFVGIKRRPADNDKEESDNEGRKGRTRDRYKDRDNEDNPEKYGDVDLKGLKEKFEERR